MSYTAILIFLVFFSLLPIFCTAEYLLLWLKERKARSEELKARHYLRKSQNFMLIVYSFALLFTYYLTGFPWTYNEGILTILGMSILVVISVSLVPYLKFGTIVPDYRKK